MSAIQHQFEFWEYLGKAGHYITKRDGYISISPQDATWPSKVFDPQFNSIQLLHTNILKGNMPNAVAIEENIDLEQALVEHEFSLTSTVKGMRLNLTQSILPPVDAEGIEKVVDQKGIERFAQIASASFGYTIYANTLESLIGDHQVQLFLTKYKGKYVNCGIVFQDQYGQSGLHMIGTPAQYRGLGLGSKMTKYLLHEAYKNQSKQVYLVASKLGAPIYEKLGFKDQSKMHSYALVQPTKNT